MRRVLLETACGCRKFMVVPDRPGHPYIDVAMVHGKQGLLEIFSPDQAAHVTLSKRSFEWQGETYRPSPDSRDDVYIYREVLR